MFIRGRGEHARDALGLDLSDGGSPHHKMDQARGRRATAATCRRAVADAKVGNARAAKLKWASTCFILLWNTNRGPSVKQKMQTGHNIL